MHKHKYVIIGGGMTAGAAVRGIRECDAGYRRQAKQRCPHR